MDERNFRRRAAERGGRKVDSILQMHESSKHTAKGREGLVRARKSVHCLGEAGVRRKTNFCRGNETKMRPFAAVLISVAAADVTFDKMEHAKFWSKISTKGMRVVVCTWVQWRREEPFQFRATGEKAGGNVEHTSN